MRSSLRMCMVLSGSVLLTLAALNPLLFAMDERDGRSTLRGLKGILVLVGPVDPKIGGNRLSKAQIQKQTELQVQKAGIHLLSQAEYNRLIRSERYPLARLDVYATVKEIRNTDLKSYDITVQVRQVAFLARKPVVKVLAPTWERRKLAYSESLEAVLSSIRELVNQFIVDYLAENP